MHFFNLLIDRLEKTKGHRWRKDSSDESPTDSESKNSPRIRTHRSRHEFKRSPRKYRPADQIPDEDAETDTDGDTAADLDPDPDPNPARAPAQAQAPPPGPPLPPPPVPPPPLPHMARQPFLYRHFLFRYPIYTQPTPNFQFPGVNLTTSLDYHRSALFYHSQSFSYHLSNLINLTFPQTSFFF